jgi:phage regulator Rha-like protein
MNKEISILYLPQTMSSLEIAKLTGKDHPKVTANIRRIIEEVGIEASGFRIPSKMPSGQWADVFFLPYRETQLVISSYSAKRRLAIIDRWQELEASKNRANIGSYCG